MSKKLEMERKIAEVSARRIAREQNKSEERKSTVSWEYHRLAWYTARCLARNFRFLAGDAGGELSAVGASLPNAAPKK